MDKVERYMWLDRCAKCKKYNPTKKKSRCPLPPALRANDPMATENIKCFTGDHGICKQYDPID